MIVIFKFFFVVVVVVIKYAYLLFHAELFYIPYRNELLTNQIFFGETLFFWRTAIARFGVVR
jgi:hypothetical protein